jgi:5'-deoxynucleotidase YfbR-like HD superfamily hydrolase
MEKGLMKFIVEQHTRLSCIIRYNNTPKICGESVAEHSYYVTFLAMLVSDYLVDRFGLEIDRAKLLKMALLHDVEEVLSGDIIKILKSGGFKKELEKMNERSMQYLTGMLEPKQGEQYYELWHQTKTKDSLESQLLDFCDLFAVVIYSIRECHLGNKYFREILQYAAKNIGAFKEQIVQLSDFIDVAVAYAASYLADDPQLAAAINSAVRVEKVVRNE